MKVHRLSPRLLLPLVLALHFVPTVGRGQEDVLRDLAEFRKKLGSKETTTTGMPDRSSQIVGQLRSLEGMMAREDFDKVQSMLGNIGNYGLPPEFQNEWMELVDRLGKTAETRRTQALEKWRLDVDQLFKDTQKACLEAKSSADLDSLLVRCAAAQMRRDTRGNILTDRAMRKLSAVAATLNGWATYLDCQNAGKITQANAALRSAATAEYPVLSNTEIGSRIMLDAYDSGQWRLFVADVCKDVKSPDDLPAILEKLEKAIPADRTNMNLSSAVQDLKKIELLSRAWSAAKEGNQDGVSKALSAYRASSGTDVVPRYLDPLVALIVNSQLAATAKGWSKLTPNPNEDASGFLSRVLEELKAERNYARMLEVLKYIDQLNRNQQPVLSTGPDRIAIENFLSAQRFEQAGDALAAVIYYRSVIGATAAPFAPKEEAEAALKKLGEAHPEAIKSYEGSMAEDIRAMRQNLQMLLNRPPMMGRPY